MTSTNALGIDIGGTSTKLGLVNRSGDLLRFTSFPSRAQEKFEYFLQDLQSITEDFLGGDSIMGIGVGAPDASPLEGTMCRPANFKWGEKVHIIENIKKVLKHDAFLTNDANAAALGELYFGAAKGMTDFVVITLGTGVGSGFICDGRLLWGKRGMAGELGHVVVEPGGRACSCGHKGCLEMYVSARGIRQTVLDFLDENEEPSSLRGYDLKTMSVRKIEKAARAGDPFAVKTFQKAGKILGSKLADLVAIFDLEAIILSGGVSKAGNLLLEPTKKSMDESTFPAFRGQTKLLVSEMENANAAVLGAAALVFDAAKR